MYNNNNAHLPLIVLICLYTIYICDIYNINILPINDIYVTTHCCDTEHQGEMNRYGRDRAKGEERGAHRERGTD